MVKNDITEFAVIGTGRFGSFWAGHLQKWHPVSLYDVDTNRLEDCSDCGKVDTLNNCLNKSYIFLTIPIRALVPFIRKNRSNFKEGTTIIDCASVKEPVMEWIDKELPSDVFYVASHPLFGPDSARKGLENHIITLIPGRVPYAIYNFLVNFFEIKLGLRVENISAQEHDRLMAYNLSLIHQLGRTFHGMQLSRIPLMMDSLGKLNHIARVVMNDSDELFQDFYAFNRFSLEVTNQFINAFKQVADLAAPDSKK